MEGDGYATEMNLGEYIHFFSGAIGEDLQPLAEEAFGWSPEGNEGSLKIIDNDINTKFLINPYVNDLYMQQEFAEPRVVNKYSLTSANDAAARDPKAWVLTGSNDGTTWEELDSREGESFSSRYLTREYNVDNDVAYKYYRLSVTENNGDGLFQLAEWRLKVLQLIELPEE